jgi:predicted RNA binding protein YcfA (HicA-like mRNA interferase family)
LKLPLDIGGHELAVLLRRYGYEVTRQTGSHIRVTTTLRGTDHHVTIPSHRAIRVGTLSAIVADVAEYLGVDKETVAQELFES